MGWSIPNIKAIFTRLGAKKAKWYAVFDLTSGYFQMLLDEDSRKYAAFITEYGVYEPVRISMGLKTAPAFFQQQMVFLLQGLIYINCEVYIDDIIIHGDSEEQFLENLELVLTRLKEKNICISPDKAKVPMQRVEFVGHVIDSEGLTMSEEKIRNVLEFEQPRTGKEMKSFLGLANYFRDHIYNFATVAGPLYEMIRDYGKSRNRKLNWGPTELQAYEAVKLAVEKCPKLYFMDAKAPVYLATDASDYGIGAHLYQVVLDKVQTVGLMSRSFNKTERKWATIEKECFAIVESFRKFYHLIRDIKFTL
jgi:hypothetical protein